MGSSAEPPLIVSVDDLDDGSRVVAAGEIDLSTADQFRVALATAANGAGSHVHVDLSGITFIDSSGLKALMERWTGASGKRWSFSGLSPAVRRIIEMTGVADVFDLGSTDVEAALAAAAAEHEAALERNREAIANGQHPPVGIGAMSVLQRRVAAARLRLERHEGD